MMEAMQDSTTTPTRLSASRPDSHQRHHRSRLQSMHHHQLQYHLRTHQQRPHEQQQCRYEGRTALDGTAPNSHRGGIRQWERQFSSSALLRATKVDESATILSMDTGRERLRPLFERRWPRGGEMDDAMASTVDSGIHSLATHSASSANRHPLPSSLSSTGRSLLDYWLSPSPSSSPSSRICNVEGIRLEAGRGSNGGGEEVCRNEN